MRGTQNSTVLPAAEAGGARLAAVSSNHSSIEQLPPKICKKK
jgi:hypothetical protein